MMIVEVSADINRTKNRNRSCYILQKNLFEGDLYCSNPYGLQNMSFEASTNCKLLCQDLHFLIEEVQTRNCQNLGLHLN